MRIRFPLARVLAKLTYAISETPLKNGMSYPFVILVAGLLLASTRDASAYIDPGSTSYLFQILVAGLTATVFFFSSIKRRIGQACRAVLRIKSEAEKGPQVDSPTARDL